MLNDQVRRGGPGLPNLQSSSRNEFVPCFRGLNREEIGGRGRSRTIVNPCLAGHDFVTQRGHLSADDCDRLGFAAGVNDESSCVVAKDKLPNEREGLHQEY